MEILLICVFVRILAVDKFVRPMLEAKPVSWLYETDTRALMLQAIQNATIFFACVRVPHTLSLACEFEPTQTRSFSREESCVSPTRCHLVKYFRGGTSSILKLSITLWPIPRQSDGDEIAFMIALYGSPILVESQAVRAVTEKYDAALDALLSPEAAVAAAVADFDESRHRRDSSNHDGLLIDAETAAADGAAVEMMVASFSGTLPQQEQAQRDQQQEQDHGQEAASIDDPACPDDITVESVESASAPSAELEPLTSVKLVYRPLLPIDPRKMNKLYFHPAYAVFFWTTCVFTILMFGLTSWNPVTVPHFTLMMMVWTTLIVLEYGRLDRALLFHCIKSFDFVFLLVYLGGFVTFQLYTVLNDASSFEDTRPAADILRANIAAKCVFAWNFLCRCRHGLVFILIRLLVLLFQCPALRSFSPTCLRF